MLKDKERRQLCMQDWVEPYQRLLPYQFTGYRTPGYGLDKLSLWMISWIEGIKINKRRIYE